MLRTLLVRQVQEAQFTVKMPWYNFGFTGTAAAAEDSATATIQETNTTAVAIPQTIRLTDLVLTGTAAESHQMSIWVNGKKQSSNLYSAQLNPASQGRFSVRGQGIVIPQGATLQMRGAQLVTGAGAENIICTMEFVAN
jgi:hypothetical protein